MNKLEFTRPSTALLKAVRWLCKPLVRLLIEKNVSYVQLRELLKEVYVEVAETEFALHGNPPSDSRIFVLTGVHRKDIKRLRQPKADTAEDDYGAPTLGAELVSRWLGTPEYLDSRNRPRRLARTSTDGRPGFDDLVAGVNKDVRPRAILDEWLRLGLISIDEKGELTLNRDSFIPRDDFEEQVFFLGRNVHDHLAACTHNLLTPDAPYLERSAFYTPLTLASIDKLRAFAQKKSAEMLSTLNKKALALKERDRDLPDARYRMRFGSYWYQEANTTDLNKD